MNLNQSIVNKFKDFLIGTGRKNFPSCVEDKCFESNSYPLVFYSWLNYYALNLDRKIIQDKVELIKVRAKKPCGNNIFNSNCAEIEHEESILYKDSIDLISLHWESMGSLIQTICPLISYPGKDDLFESASNPKLFGQILYSMNSDCLIKWSEVIVHEIAHHYLNVLISSKSNITRLKTKWSQKSYSRIRNEERPLIGILHATFAESCILIMMDQIIKNDLIVDNQYKALEIFNKYSRIFRQEYETVKKNKLLDFDENISNLVEYSKELVFEYV